MRGAPQVGFSATIRKIRARTSLLARFCPPTRRNLEIHVQYKRNPARCQFTTVRGVTKTGGLRSSLASSAYLVSTSGSESLPKRSALSSIESLHIQSLLPRRTPASAYLVVALLGPSEATRRECHK